MNEPIYPHESAGTIPSAISSEAEFDVMFPDEESARIYVEACRWPQGRYCPTCGSHNTRVKLSSNLPPYRCRDCETIFSVRHGTFLYRTQRPLRSWLKGIFLLTLTDERVSTAVMMAKLGIQKYSADHLIAMYRQALFKARNGGGEQWALSLGRAFVQTPPGTAMAAVAATWIGTSPVTPKPQQKRLKAALPTSDIDTPQSPDPSAGEEHQSLERITPRPGSRRTRATISTENYFDIVFPNEDAAKDYIEACRWPDGRSCPRCSGRDIRAAASNPVQPYTCRDCGKRFSVRDGTFLYRTPKPLLHWLKFIFLITISDEQPSALTLTVRLKTDKGTVDYLNAKYQDALADARAGGSERWVLDLIANFAPPTGDDGEVVEDSLIDTSASDCKVPDEPSDAALREGGAAPHPGPQQPAPAQIDPSLVPRRLRAQISCEKGFDIIFPDEHSAREYVETCRWHEGRFCPKCGSSSTMLQTPDLTQPYKCRACLKSFSVRHGTFLFWSRRPLRTWLRAIFLITTRGEKLPVGDLANKLGMTKWSTEILVSQYLRALDDARTGGSETWILDLISDFVRVETGSTEVTS